MGAMAKMWVVVDWTLQPAQGALLLQVCVFVGLSWVERISSFCGDCGNMKLDLFLRLFVCRAKRRAIGSTESVGIKGSACLMVRPCVYHRRQENMSQPVNTEPVQVVLREI